MTPVQRLHVDFTSENLRRALAEFKGSYGQN